MKFILTGLAVCMAFPWVASAQKNEPGLEQLPRIPVDTVEAGRKPLKVVLFTNNTWEYFYPDTLAQSSSGYYSDHWVTDKVFAYTDIAFSELPQSTEIKLIDSLADFHSPVVGKVYSRYGVRGSRHKHKGVDVPLKHGEPVYAAFAGKVRYSRYNTGGYGNLVIIRHPNGLETWYAHLARRNAETGDYIPAGAVIGFGGSTGRSRGAHLHFETRYRDQNFDPERIIDFASGDLLYHTFLLEKSYLDIHSRASEDLEEGDEWEDILLASADGSPATSEVILANIEKAQRQEISPSGTPDPLYHTIRNGDNLTRIARRYGTTVGELCRLNGITEKTVIRAGRRLRVR